MNKVLLLVLSLPQTATYCINSHGNSILMYAYFFRNTTKV